MEVRAFKLLTLQLYEMQEPESNPFLAFLSSEEKLMN